MKAAQKGGEGGGWRPEMQRQAGGRDRQGHQPVQEGASRALVEIILFSNSADAAKRFDALRKKKPHLG